MEQKDDSLAIVSVEHHIPVMQTEVLQAIKAENGGFFIDATLGLGGHTEAILRAHPGNRVLGIDRDPQAVRHAKRRLERFSDRFECVNATFDSMPLLIKQNNYPRPAAILADLGVSSMQLDDPGRGFSFRFDAPLDMRMSPDEANETAAEMLRRLSEAEIADIIYRFGEERFARRIARKIVERRDAGDPVETTLELAELVRSAIPSRRTDKIHPATRTFQALRIFVNRELDLIEPFMKASIEVLAPNGILAIITFHSLEDRIVKHTMQRCAGKCVCPPRAPACGCGAKKMGEILTKKPITPTMAEREANPRSRSAKLRVFRRSH